MRVLVLSLLVLSGCVVHTSASFSEETRDQLMQDGQQRSIHWKTRRFPLRVDLTSLPKGKRVRAQEALRWWNDTIGKEVFTASAHLPDIEIRVDFSLGIIACVPNWNTLRLGYTEMDAVYGEMQHSSVSIANNMTFEVESTVLIHELGHALGLKHDTNMLSLMYHTIWSPWMQTVQPEDLAAVREEMDVRESRIPDYPTLD